MISVLVLVSVLQLGAAEPAPPAQPPAEPVPAPAPEAPRRIEDLSKPLTGAVPQGTYEERLRGAFSRTQSLQGPLDGTWMLKDAGGVNLYRVQLVDPGFNGGRLEGAWQDLRVGTAPDASGFFTGVTREGTHLTLQLARAGAASTVITLDPRPEGGFAGDLKAGEKTEHVTLARP